MKFASRVQHRAKSAGFVSNPEKKNESNHQHERRADAFEKFDHLDAAPYDQHVDGPEGKKTDPVTGGKTCRAGPDDAEHGEDGLPSDPGLNSEPPASDKRAENRRNIGTANAEGCAHKNRKWNAVASAGVGIQEHG